MPNRLRFGRQGRFELRWDERVLLEDGQPLSLGSRAFDVLVALIEHRERVLTKSELLELAWPGLIVEENNLSVQISSLRKQLGVASIATIPSRGYRFAMEVHNLAVREVSPPPAAPPTVEEAQWSSSERGAWLAAQLHAGPSAEVSPDAPGWHSEIGAQAQAVIAGLGGRLQWRADGSLLARLPSAHAAAAASHRLHDAALSLMGGWPVDAHSGLQLGISADGPTWRRADAPMHGSLGPAARANPDAPTRADGTAAGEGGLALDLAALAQVGETLVSADLAQQLILNLDGDLQDLGSHDALHVDKPIRIFRLSAPSAPGAPSASLLARADARLVPITQLAPAASVAPMPPLQRVQTLRPTLALLPFSPYARDQGVERLGDVIADQLIGALSRSHAINVISRLSTLPFRDREASVQQIATRLGADFVVSGRYWANAGKVTVLVEVADAASGQVVWTQSLSDDETAALQSDSTLIHGLVSGVLQAVFRHEVGSLRSQPLPDLASHTLLLAAISLLYRLSPRDFALARTALETLHERAPRHATPLAWLARWHLFRVVQGQSSNRDEDGRLALDCAQRALDLDPDSSLALTMLGNVNTSYLRDLDTAGRLYDQALHINPNESLAWLQKGNALSFAGDGAGALAHTQKALSLSPLDPAQHFYLSLLASAALTAHDWPRAIDAARQSLRLNQEHVSSHRTLAIALAMSGQGTEARSSVRRVLSMEPGLTVAGFVARSPGARSGMALEFGRALHQAGLPLGDIELN